MSYLSENELGEVRREVLRELAEVEQMCHCPGSYTYCCCTPAGVVYLAHHPHGQVLRHLPEAVLPPEMA